MEIESDSVDSEHINEVDNESSDSDNSSHASDDDEHRAETYNEPVGDSHDIEPALNSSRPSELEEEVEILEESEGDKGDDERVQERTTPEVNTTTHIDNEPNSVLALVIPSNLDSGMNNDNRTHEEPSISIHQGSSQITFWKGHKVSESDWKLLVAVDTKFPDTFTEMGFHTALGSEIGLSSFCRMLREFLSTIVGRLDENGIVCLRGSLQDTQSMLKSNLSWAFEHLAKVMELKSKCPLLPELVSMNTKVEALSTKEERLEQELTEVKQMIRDLHDAREAKLKEAESQIGSKAMTLVNCSIGKSLIPCYTLE